MMAFSKTHFIGLKLIQTFANSATTLFMLLEKPIK